MKIIENETPVMVDCDQTLVMWHDRHQEPIKGVTVEFKDPYDQGSFFLKPHEAHIKLLKQQKGRGKAVVVWSAAGYLWAKEVVEKLELEEYVDLIMAKPCKYIDDLPCEEFMGNRIYIKE